MENSAEPIKISRLTKVSIRDVWQSEPYGFTPWLSSKENLPLLGESIGLRLEMQSTEESVGDFRADIVCKSLPDGDLVLIENQFSQSDHTHLGQILTYTAGLEAVTIVWIAEKIRDEHRAAIDWLNEKTPENINFFALEIELWRIDESPIAPKFNIVCRPNEWTRSVVDATRAPSEHSEFRWSYWSGFVRQPALVPILSRTLSPNRQGNLPVPTAWREFMLQVYVSSTEADAAVYLSCRGSHRFRNFQQLQLNKDAIERAVGGPLKWYCNESLNRAWIVLDVSEIDPSKKDDWPRQQQILAERTAAFFLAIDPFVRPLEQPAI